MAVGLVRWTWKLEKPSW